MTSNNVLTILTATILFSILTCVLSTTVPKPGADPTLRKARRPKFQLPMVHTMRKRKGKRKGPEFDGDGDSDSNDGGSSKSGDGETACFPGTALVQTPLGRSARLSEVDVGDEIASVDSAFSRVFAFSHRVADTRHEFVRIATARGNLTATRGHFVHTPTGAKPAGSLRRGDFLVAASGDSVRIIDTRVVYGRGLYNPHTLTGDIVVDGFRATCFTTAVPLVPAQSLLAPFRWLFRFVSTDALSTFVQKGVPASAASCFRVVLK